MTRLGTRGMEINKNHFLLRMYNPSFIYIVAMVIILYLKVILLEWPKEKNVTAKSTIEKDKTNKVRELDVTMIV